MRTVLFLLLGLFVFQTAQAKPPKDLKKFTKSFEKAVKLNTYSDLMPFFDDAYVKEQHDMMLEGRTEQFVREFLGGKNEKTGSYETPKDITVIKKIKVNNVQSRDDGSWSATLTITHWDGTRYTKGVIIKPQEWTSKSPHSFGFEGAYG